MEKWTLYLQVLSNYKDYINFNFKDRFLGFNNLKDVLVKDIFEKFDHHIIGQSEEGRPIYNINVGYGKTKILLWSQMHGNESTTTKAIFDFLNFIEKEKKSDFVQTLLDKCHICIIPMLNPDGASKYTRLNANLVDLNRDALDQSQTETRVFFKHLELFKPDFCFNMHGQRTIFSAGETKHPATMSFLAPSYNIELNINSSRLRALKLIGGVNTMLQNFIPNQVGRYDDTHNLNCFGDYIQKMNIPTVLFEAGHYQKDYNRNETRKYILLSLLNMFKNIMSSDIDNINQELYFKIPLNKKLYLDCIIKNVKNSQSGWVGIQFKEVLKNESIVFQPFISQLDDLSTFYAHHCLDAKNKNIIINSQHQLQTNMEIDELICNDERIKF